MRSLHHAISTWDKKNVAYLRGVYKDFGHEYSFKSDLLSLLTLSPELENGVTWLTKHYLEDGGKFTRKDILLIAGRLAFLVHWKARLHILQIFSAIEIPEEARASIYFFAELNSEHENPFIRAWAYQTMYNTSFGNKLQQRQLLKRCVEIFDQEKASVRSRLKKIIAGLEKQQQ